MRVEVSAEKKTPKVVPERSSLEDSKLDFLPPAIIKTRITAVIAPINAPIGIKNDTIENITAPKVAPAETPISPGSARLFLKKP